MNVWHEIYELFKEFGKADYIGEPISQINHAVQCGKLAIDLFPHDSEFVTACLLHDVGELVGLNQNMSRSQLGTKAHEYVGAEFLERRGFTRKTCELVREHVRAKRYLCYSNSDYYDALSFASKQTLEQQGGPLTDVQAQQWLKSPWAILAVQVRLIDDRGKDVTKSYTSKDFADFQTYILNSLNK